MADTSLIIGNGNWAVKETSLLGYNIIQSKYVPIEMTVSRNTTATRVNSAGLIEVVPRNLLTYSNTFTDGSWTRYNCTIIANNTMSPDGSVNASKLTSNASNNNYLLKSVTAANGIYTFSCFVKYFDTNTITISLTDSVLGQAFGFFDFTSGTFTSLGQSGAWTNTTTNVITLPLGWFKISITSQKNAGVDINPRINGFADTTSVYVYGAQLETGPTATEYFPTTDRFNIPRVDYLNSTTGSLLVEPERINRLFYSEQFDNLLGWSAVNAIVNANVAVAPDNNTTADKFIPTLVNSVHFLQQTPLASYAYTFSVFAKAGGETTFSMWLVGGSKKAEFNLTGIGDVMEKSFGVTAEIEPYPNGWYRCSMYNALAGTDVRIYGRGGSAFEGNGVDGIFLWGAQAEATTVLNPTSYIPTVAGIATRTADVITKTGISSLIGQTEGTIFMDLNFTNLGVDKYILVINNTANTNSIGIRRLSSGAIRIVLTATTTSGTTSQSSAVLANGNYKIAYRYISGSIKLYINGALSFSETPTFTFGAAIDNIKLGTSGSSEQLNDRINSFQLFKTALDNDQCIDLTKIT